MIYYLLIPVFSLLLIMFQITVLDLLFLGKIRLELSLILVVYAGLHMDVVKGGTLSFVMGFFLDCMTSLIPGLFTFIYMVIFLVSKSVSCRFYSEKTTFIIIFTFICAFLEGIIIFFVYQFMFRVNILNNILNTYLLQSLAVAVLGPVCFTLFNRFEALLNEGKE
ncbi:MAG: hypothetical protein J7J07_08550 [Syntrophobacterales bacterium]|nr:hypothetical protein [Syntrophobacterales bacterium]